MFPIDDELSQYKCTYVIKYIKMKWVYLKLMQMRCTLFHRKIFIWLDWVTVPIAANMTILGSDLSLTLRSSSGKMANNILISTHLYHQPFKYNLQIFECSVVIFKDCPEGFIQIYIHRCMNKHTSPWKRE